MPHAVGDLIRFWGCHDEGSMGMILAVPEYERFGPGTGLYSVLFARGMQVFTGNQLVIT